MYWNQYASSRDDIHRRREREVVEIRLNVLPVILRTVACRNPNHSNAILHSSH